MTGVRNSLTFTQSDALAEVVSGQSCHIVLETSPPDYVEKISRYLESSEGRSRQHEVTLSNEPAEADSDSGDSLFITQKAVPEAVRSGRRQRHYSLRSNLTSPGDHEESDEDNSLSASPEESKTGKERRRKKYTLLKYRFPFLAEKKLRSNLLPTQNGRLHNYVMGGFFKCVRELWQNYQRQEDLESSLPTVDVNGEDISPLSEEDEEKVEDEDIKVVVPSELRRYWKVELKHCRSQIGQSELSLAQHGTSYTIYTKPRNRHQWFHSASLWQLAKNPAYTEGVLSIVERIEKREKDLVQEERKRFVALSKPKSAQTWGSPSKKQRRRKAGNAGQETLRGGQTMTLPKKTVKPVLPKDVKLLSDTDISDNEEPPPRGLVQRERNDERATTDRNSLTQSETLKAKRHLTFQQRAIEEELFDNSDATVCEPPELPISPCQSTQKGREASPTVTEPETHVHTDEMITTGEAGDGPEREHLPKKRKKKKKDKGDNEGVEEEKGQSLEEPEGLHAATSEDLSHNDNTLRQDKGDTPDSKHKKKKRKKNKPAAEDVIEEEDGNLESDVRVEDGGKKKKKRRRSEDVAEVAEVAEPLNDEIKKKKKKKRKKEEEIAITEECEDEVLNRTADLPLISTEQLEESGNCLETAAASSQETLSHVKKKKHKKKRQSSSNEATQDGEEGVDVNLSLDDSVTSAKTSGMSLKKKKAIFESIFDSSEQNEKVQNVGSTQETKEGIEDQNAELVTKKKKKKKKKSDADAKEKEAQTHGEQNSPSQSPVLGAENPGVSAGCTEELDGTVKKKRKRKVSEDQDSAEKPDFDELNEAFLSSLPETTDTGVKKKKRHKGNESVSVTPVKRFESAADAGLSPTDESAVLKKKKFKDHLLRESPPAATDDVESVTSSLNRCSSVSHKAKGKHGPSADDSSTTENPASNVVTHKKKKKKKKSSDDVLLEGKSLTEPAELEPRENKKKERNKLSAVPSSSVSSETSLSKSEMSSPASNTKNKHRKVKRRLYVPSEDVLTDR